MARRPKSLWSQVNVDTVAELTAAGRMREPRLAEVRRAQEDGRWGGGVRVAEEVRLEKALRMLVSGEARGQGGQPASNRRA
ncbi:hypothetical protein AB0P36_02545 [Streptomyces flavidovirens]|uniref:hypothetical protein n=1 Tax=Streptomyces flavidovirens TaxID=67298 RepID=UPI0034200BD6